MLDDKALLRYSRQLMMADFDVAGQEKLRAASVMVVGLGGLGCPAALYLAAAGIGTLVLADGDRVEISNLQRQIAHGEDDLGLNKAASAAAAITAINSTTKLQVLAHRLEQDTLAGHLTGIDLVVDATDNFPTRFALNIACHEAGVPLVSASAIRAEGQLSVFDTRQGGPCYRCLYTPGEDDTALSCSESGVLAPLVGVLGALQAMEAVKIISGFGEPLVGRLQVFDLARGQVRELRLNRRPDCPVCSGAVGAD